MDTTLAEADLYSTAMDMSDDGTVIVGHGRIKGGTMRAFRWMKPYNMEALEGPTDYRNCFALAISGNGGTIIGYGEGHQGKTALRWIKDGREIENIADFLTTKGVDLTGWKLEKATGVSRDGKIIIGESQQNGLTKAWMAVVETGHP